MASLSPLPRRSGGLRRSGRRGLFSDPAGAHQTGALVGVFSPGPYVTPGLYATGGSHEAISA